MMINYIIFVTNDEKGFYRIKLHETSFLKTKEKSKEYVFSSLDRMLVSFRHLRSQYEHAR
jgi:hypothetical protein